MGDIVWLASYPKSGNTWMRAFLHNFFLNAKRPVNLNRLQGQVSQSDGMLMWFQMLDQRPCEEWTTEDVARMRPKVNELIARGQTGTVFCKTHNAMVTAYGFPTINLQVTSGAIYIVRNPLDLASSLADYSGITLGKAIDWLETDDLETESDAAFNHIKLRLGSWSQHVESWTGRPNPRLHVVRYEDMLANPAKAFGEVSRFLRLKSSRQRLLRAVRNSSFDVMRRQEERHGFNERSAHQERFFRRGTAGGWKEELTDEQVRRICEAHGEQMKRFGYMSPGGQPAIG